MDPGINFIFRGTDKRTNDDLTRLMGFYFRVLTAAGILALTTLAFLPEPREQDIQSKGRNNEPANVNPTTPIPVKEELKLMPNNSENPSQIEAVDHKQPTNALLPEYLLRTKIHTRTI